MRQQPAHATATLTLELSSWETDEGIEEDWAIEVGEAGGVLYQPSLHTSA